MKKIFVSVLAVASLMACTKEEIVKVQAPFAIEYDGAYVDAQTRAAVDPSTTSATIAAFNAYGFMDNASGVVFNGDEVTKVGSAWSYANTQYWMPGHSYYFAALAPMNSNNWQLDTTGNNKLGAGLVTFTNVDGTEDLLYAATAVTTGDKITSQPAPVKFAFSHLLSKVKFTFSNGFGADNMSVIVSDVKMTVPGAASIDLDVKNWWDNDDWKLDASAENVTLAFGDVVELTEGASDEVANERLTIPADADQEYIITFNVTVKVGDVVAIDNELRTAKVTGVALEMGKAYNFQATLDHSNVFDSQELYPIVFEVDEVKDWVTSKTDAQVKEAEFRASMAFGGIVKLTEDVVITAPVTVPAGVTTVLDLNGHNIINTVDSDVYGEGEAIISYGNLTINGNGIVEGCTRAVWARGNQGAVVTINGGTFKGAKEGFAEGGCSVIYASSNNTINIYGGTFEALAADKTSYANKTEGVYAALNIQDNGGFINVYGGTFVKFNPAAPGTEPKAWNESHPNGFVAEGYFSNPDGDNYVVAEAQLVTTAEELAAALKSDAENIAVKLNNDIECPISSVGTTAAGDAKQMGGESTKTITIDLNNHKLLLTTTYWSVLGAKNSDAVVTIKNGIMTSSQATGTWNSYDLGFANCNYKFENVTFEKAIALSAEGKNFTLKNVTINETHDYYAIWVEAIGQNITIDGLTINSAGRGIKIDEQYISSPSKVTMNVNNATFTTNKKAAILVKSVAGADINITDINISQVAKDAVNAVWVDSDSAAYAHMVTVTGASCITEP